MSFPSWLIKWEAFTVCGIFFHSLCMAQLCCWTEESLPSCSSDDNTLESEMRAAAFSHLPRAQPNYEQPSIGVFYSQSRRRKIRNNPAVLRPLDFDDLISSVVVQIDARLFVRKSVRSIKCENALKFGCVSVFSISVSFSDHFLL